MSALQLVETTTSDGFIHQGIFFQPQKSTSRAIMWIHGLTSTFYANVSLMNEFIRSCDRTGYGFLSMNTRGHDMLTGIKKLDANSEKGYTRVSGGSSCEVFNDSLFDLEAGKNYLHSNGYDEVVLVGHSTGANKVCYYSKYGNSTGVLGYVLASPVSDRYTYRQKEIALQQLLSKTQTLISDGKGSKLCVDIYEVPMTPLRFLSLMDAQSAENIFDYADSCNHLKQYLQECARPMFVVFGEHDEHIHTDITFIKQAFDAVGPKSRFNSVIIPNALHGFGGNEKEFVAEIFRWIKEIM